MNRRQLLAAAAASTIPACLGDESEPAEESPTSSLTTSPTPDPSGEVFLAHEEWENVDGDSALLELVFWNGNERRVYIEGHVTIYQQEDGGDGRTILARKVLERLIRPNRSWVAHVEYRPEGETSEREFPTEVELVDVRYE